MRNVIIVLFVIVAFVACKPKPWNKEYLLDKCVTEMGKDKEMKNTLTAEQQAQVCECSVDKILAKYPSKKDADKDKAGVDAIGVECATSILMPEQNTTDSTTIDTTVPADTTVNPSDTTHMQ